MVLTQRTVETKLSGDLLSTVAPQGRPITEEQLSDEEIVALIDGARPTGGRRRDSYHMAMQRQWWVNILYYVGIQSLESADVLENTDPGLLAQQSGYVANHILRMVAGNVARLAQAKPDWSVIPNSPDQRDQDGAKFAQHLLDYAYDHLDLERERVMRNLWLDTCGTCFDYASWRHNVGQVRRIYINPVTDVPIDQREIDPRQRAWLDQIQSFKEIQDGDWEYELLSPFQVVVPPRFVKLERMPWVLIRRVMSLDEVWDRWPEKAPEIGPAQMNNELAGHFWQRLPLLSARPGMGITSAQDQDDAVIVDELWIPPSGRCQTGLYVVASRETILERGPHRFHRDNVEMRFPLVDDHNLRVPGRFHGMGTVEHLIGAQRDYNRSRDQIIQQRDILATPQWLAPEGSVKRTVLRNEAGDWIEYNPTKGKPELQNPPALSELHVATAGAARDDMQMIAAFSEASLGQMPQGARSGNAVMALQERDQLSIGVTVKGLERSTELLGTNLLRLAAAYMRVPRAIAVYGESRQADIQFFRGDDLHNNVRVRVRAGSMMPKNKAQTFELISQLLQLGALNPADPREKRLILEALEVGGHEKLFNPLDMARRRARIENRMFARPEQRADFAFPEVSVFDDHQAHWEEHLLFTYTDEYELLPVMRKLYFQAHLQSHAMAIGQVIEAQQIMGQMQGGGGPQPRVPGEASPPRQRQETPGTVRSEMT